MHIASMTAAPFTGARPIDSKKIRKGNRGDVGHAAALLCAHPSRGTDETLVFPFCRQAPLLVKPHRSQPRHLGVPC
jgi:hypothetical protein